MRRIVTYSLALIVLVGALVPFLASAQSSAGKVEITDFLVTNTQEHVLVYCKLKNCFTTEIEEAILAGISTTFIFTIELYRQRDFWTDKKEAVLEIKHSVKYDSVKKTLYVSFTEIDKDPEQFKELAKAEKAMADLSGVPVAPLSRLIRDNQYYIRVKAKLDKVNLPGELKNTLIFSSLWHFETDWFRQDFIY